MITLPLQHPSPQLVPFLPAEYITFAAVAATLLTLGCTDASIVPLSLNRSVAPANNVRKDSGEIRTLAVEKTRVLALFPKSACTIWKECLHSLKMAIRQNVTYF